MDAFAHFRGKKITLMRIGLLGRGVGDAKFLVECGAEVLVVDDAPQGVMQPSVDALSKYPNIRFKFGPYDLEDFKNCDLVLKGSGAALNSPEIAAAKAAGVPVRMSADLFAELAGIPVVGVTGTRGKSTVTHMLHHILEAAGKKVLLGGNVRGVSTLALLKEVTSEHIAVFELDSWQLQGFGEAKISPHIAVFTTFYPDHVNYYREHPEQYLADKTQIFLNQGEADTLILGAQCAPTIIDKFGEQIKSKTRVVDALTLPDTWVLQVPGVHNRYDGALALAAARELGISDGVSRYAFQSFTGVPGRLELVREVGSVKYYNDTTATTPEATLAALAALDSEKTVIIAGGSDKALPLGALIAGLQKAKRVVLLAGNGTERIRGELPDAPVFDALAPALAAARSAAAPGDAILFSPGFTSFGMFTNEFDRGDQFTALIRALS